MFISTQLFLNMIPKLRNDHINNRITNLCIIDALPLKIVHVMFNIEIIISSFTYKYD